MPTIVHSAGVSESMLEQFTDFFRLLSDKTRLNILMILRDGEKNVTALCERLNLPQPTVSHHLGLLRTNSLIGNRRAGKQVFYALSNRFHPAGDGVLNFRAEAFTVRLDPKMRESN